MHGTVVTIFNIVLLEIEFVCVSGHIIVGYILSYSALYPRQQPWFNCYGGMTITYCNIILNCYSERSLWLRKLLWSLSLCLWFPTVMLYMCLCVRLGACLRLYTYSFYPNPATQHICVSSESIQVPDLERSLQMYVPYAHANTGINVKLCEAVMGNYLATTVMENA